MSDDRLSSDEFLLRLGELFNACRTSEHGSVYLTQKRLSPYGEGDGKTKKASPSGTTVPDLHLAHPLPVLIRATNGKGKKAKTHKIKFSTVIEPDQLESFFTKYADVCKAGMSGLKKRDRSARKAKEKKRKKEKKEAEKK